MEPGITRSLLYVGDLCLWVFTNDSDAHNWVEKISSIKEAREQILWPMVADKVYIVCVMTIEDTEDQDRIDVLRMVRIQKLEDKEKLAAFELVDEDYLSFRHKVLLDWENGLATKWRSSFK